MEERLNGLEYKLDTFIDAVQSAFEKIDKNLESFNKRFDAINIKLNAINEKAEYYKVILPQLSKSWRQVLMKLKRK